MRSLRFALALVAAALTGGCFHARPCPCPVAASDVQGPPAQAKTGAGERPAAVVEPAPAAVKVAPTGPALPRVIERIRFAAVGDVISHGDVLRAAEAADDLGVDGKSVNHAGFDALLSGVREDLAGRDLVFANLETPVAPRAGAHSVPFSFNAPPALLEALKGVGVKMLSFANNHVYDQDRAGLVESLDRLDASGLVYAGAGRTCEQARRARIWTVAGIKLGFLASSTLYNQRLNRGEDKPCAAEFDEKKVLAEVAAARKAGAELVVLSVHWGSEYHTAPRPEDVALAHRLLEGGVDVILGHHPHVLQPVEIYRAADGRICLVAYSLGNFLSNQSRFYVHGVQPAKMGNPRDGVILGFSVIRADYGQGQTRIELADVSVRPLWTENNALDRQRDPDLPVVIRMAPDDRLAARVQERLAGEPAPAARVALLRELRVLTERRAIAAAVLGEDLLAEPAEPAKVDCPGSD